MAERNIIKGFLLSDCDEEDAENSAAEQIEDFARGILEESEITKKARLNSYVSKYQGMLHIESQSNVVKRLFSHAKLIMTPQRRCMNPYRLESLLLLGCNYFLWDATTLQEALRADPDVEDENAEDDDTVVS